MYPASQLLVYILGLTSLALPFSCAAPAAASSSPAGDFSLVDDVDPPPISSPSTKDPAVWTNSPHPVAARTVSDTGTELLTKRETKYINVVEYDAENEAWEISERPDSKTSNILGWMTPGEYIAGGGQGHVYSGTWEGHRRKTDGSWDCGQVNVAVKISAGTNGYDEAEKTRHLASPYIAYAYAYAMEYPEKPTNWNGQQIWQWSWVAYEKLGIAGDQMINDYFYDFDRAPMFKGLGKGLRDLMTKGYFNLDIKLDNLMIEDPKNRKQDAVWKIIDLGLLKPKTDEPIRFRFGTYDYMAPEPYYDRQYYGQSAMVFMFVITVYYSFHLDYEEPVKPFMRTIQGTDSYRSRDVRWLWAAMMYPGLSKDEVLNSLPRRYQRGESQQAWGEFYAGTLCAERNRETGEMQRLSFDQMWDYLKVLMPAIDS